MESIKLVKNLYHDENGIYALDTSNNKAHIFVRQGSLDSGCVIYSLVMLLILQKWFTRKDIKSKAPCTSNDFVDKFKKRFLYKLKGFCARGYNPRIVAQQLREINNDIAVEFYNTTNRKDKIESLELANIIIKHLSEGTPVMLRYYNISQQIAHAVLAIGLMKSESKVTFFCLDPSAPLRVYEFWNSIIESNIELNSSKLMVEGERVIIDGAMVINLCDCPLRSDSNPT